jgi:two-component system, chemotaxis family, CheB/CheR fusion protein
MAEQEREREDLSSEEEEDSRVGTREEVLPPDSDPEWGELLQYLLTARGFDFHGYKPASLARRIRKRMEAVGAGSYAAYQDFLEVHPNEFNTLFNTILINVTGFFRDPAAWEVVRTTAIPQILGNKSAGEPIRAWSAGCATGEEAYTIAMLLAEELGPDEFRERVKIYATDVDDEALNAARHGAYSSRAIEGVPADLLEKYFEQVDGLHFFRKDFRRSVIFGRHDLINDAPISRIDLLTCRNTLMYLNAETQSRVLARLHFALNEGGFLLLGRAETLMAHGQTFVPVDLKRRLSRKSTRGHTRDRTGRSDEPATQLQPGDFDSRLRTAAIEASPVAQLVVDAAGNLSVINDRARVLFGLRPSDAGRPLKDLQLSYRPVELRSLIEKAENDRRPLVIKEIDWPSPMGESRWVDLHVAPLTDALGAVTGTILTFTDVTSHRRLQRELEESHQELETAYEELQSTNEELETTNEELQSTVEELETTNEELQSTNEELETMNEELQSTNEELQTMNDELRTRGDELNAANAFLESILGSLQGGVAVVDRDLKILAWNDRAEDLWGLREAEVAGQHFLNLDIGLPVDQLRTPLRKCLQGETESETLVLNAVNRRGKGFQCQVTCTPLHGTSEVRGAILVMEEAVDA